MKDEFKTGNPIWIYYRDIDNNDNLRLPQLLRGHLGQSYDIKKIKIPNYNLVQITGTLKGTFDNTAKSVCFYYRKQTWGEIQNVDLYLHLKTPVTIYDQVAGMPLSDKLPGNIYVKSFQRIATTTREFWYQINADQWVKFDDDQMTLVEHDPFTEQKATKPIVDLTYLKLNKVKATVDFLPNRAIDTYDQPYGLPLTKLANGTSVTLIARVKDDNGVTWYETDNSGYINASYIQLDDKDGED
ncbi:MAG TPA: MucBP domain-containing protein [Candidatus Limosilactobacillus faecipullorum]|nr:MucBP domain-containing protein [Candidatus Limosilactobacillus faecipullorum]